MGLHLTPASGEVFKKSITGINYSSLIVVGWVIKEQRAFT
jgi:hypothetical protein